ncbi:MAG TPA: hypothetical protein VLB67_12290 [Acidimicrobiia bacterium]|nr:hypothetical protein [Acidimicrobiia bacterium]
MRRWVVGVALVATGCGASGASAEGEMAAATFLVEASAGGVVVAGNDRFANTGDENRLDVIVPGEGATVLAIHPSTPVPEPFAFVRDPLRAGGVETVLASADTIVAVVLPLIDRTPGGRVLVGSLIALDGRGEVVGTDYDDVSDQAIAALVRWGSEQGLTPLESLHLAVRGLGGDDDERAQEAAAFLE